MACRDEIKSYESCWDGAVSVELGEWDAVWALKYSDTRCSKAVKSKKFMLNKLRSAVFEQISEV